MLPALGGRSTGLRLERVRASKRFRDGGFRNSAPVGVGLQGSPLPLLGELFFGDAARTPPAPLEALPPLDAVIVSHDHYDHLDLPTVRALAARDVLFVTSLGVGAHLEAWGVPPARIVELDWWEQATLRGGDLVLRAAPSQHFSGRGVSDRNATLWSSFVVETARQPGLCTARTEL